MLATPSAAACRSCAGVLGERVVRPTHRSPSTSCATRNTNVESVPPENAISAESTPARTARSRASAAVAAASEAGTEGLRREIALSGVAADGHHAATVQLPRHSNRGGAVGARRDADQQAFVASERPRVFDRLRIFHGEHAIVGGL